MAAKTANVRIPIFHFIRQNADVKKGFVTMAIISLPQPTHINSNANIPLRSPGRLKCATIPRKIKESAKVLGTVRLFRLLPQNITDTPGRFKPCCRAETVSRTFSCQQPVRTIKITKLSYTLLAMLCFWQYNIALKGRRVPRLQSPEASMT